MIARLDARIAGWASALGILPSRAIDPAGIEREKAPPRPDSCRALRAQTETAIADADAVMFSDYARAGIVAERAARIAQLVRESRQARHCGRQQ